MSSDMLKSTTSTFHIWDFNPPYIYLAYSESVPQLYPLHVHYLFPWIWIVQTFSFIYRSVSKLSILFHRPICLFLCRYHIAFKYCGFIIGFNIWYGQAPHIFSLITKLIWLFTCYINFKITIGIAFGENWHL